MAEEKANCFIPQYGQGCLPSKKGFKVMQKRVTVTERRERNLEGGGVWQKTEALRVLSAQGREKGSFFCGLALAQQRCPVQVVRQVVVHVIWMENQLGNILERFPGSGGQGEGIVFLCS